MKAAAFAALVLTPILGLAAPASAQSWNSQGSWAGEHQRTWSSQGSNYGYRNDFNGQADRPGDYRCDAYWDARRNDCGAAWRDQRPYGRASYGHGYGSSSYGRGGGYVYQPYNQGTQYYGAYGRPDQVYPGGGYGGQAGGYRDHQRSAYCAARYRSYDPGSGYYRAYSGRLVFCG